MLEAFAKRFIRPAVRWLGVDIVRYRKGIEQISDCDDITHEIWEAVTPVTMTSPARIAAVVQAVRYVHDNNIPGDLVECGVWRGGSAMAMAMTLKSLGATDRRIYLYDTFEGMSQPTDEDVSHRGLSAMQEFKASGGVGDISTWCLGTLEEVKTNLAQTGYPEQNIKYVKGRIEETVPETMPNRIALLRLDTDWYESTKHELEHMFPVLSPDGVLIVDDYGDWKGARKAVDEYIARKKPRILLNRIDFTGRIAVKSANQAE